jgi:hypothetical protein
VPSDKRGDIRNPHQAFRKMFCAMNTVENEFVFQTQGGHFPAVDVGAVSGEEILDGHGFGVITESGFGVQFDDVLCAGPAERYSSGIFPARMATSGTSE